MAIQQLPLSQEALAQFNLTQVTEPGGLLRRRGGSISTRRSSQSGDQHHLKSLPPLLLKGAEGNVRPPGTSRQNSIFSNPNSPFLRRESLSLGKRLSIGAWAPGGRVSFSGLPLVQPAREIRVENTYRTQPDEGCFFNVSQVQRVLQATLENYLSEGHYNPATCGRLSQNLSDLMRVKTREITPPRYKLVCLVVLGQHGNQGLQIASRCLWDTKSDNCAVAVFQNSSLFAVAMVHGVYCE
ncbi:tctex1 domain-containing protein 4 [Megalops cyprinoides]|uniref:tctex1 domain-containing protein 4 n=1 Tax=Megalops cyprinoides TaxID=118141 RepID=UPI001864E059|nr:tctex1 domain-containing protein 4 [Megalops cyprinoides]